MVNKKLQEIGRKLDVTDKDIKDIKKTGFFRGVLYWIIGVIVAVIAYIIGFFVGNGACPSCPVCPTPPTTPGGGGGGGYPYAAGLLIPVALSCKKKKSKIAILLVSAIAFLIALKAAPVFGQAILYNVFSKKK